MPELPDVAACRRYLQRHALRQPIAHTRVRDRRLLRGISAAALSRRLAHEQLTATRRHGKHLFARSGKGWLTLHFGMTGTLRYYDRAQEDIPPHTGLLLEFGNGHALAYRCPRRLGRIGWTEGVEDFVRSQHLGPDALDHALDAGALRRRLGARGAIKARLLDQSRIAGIGNLYADEILYQAGIHPATAVRLLTGPEVRRLHRVMRRVLRTAARHGGRVAELPRRWLLPHREGDHRCPRCGGTATRTSVGGRTTWYCPGCQRKRA